MVGITLSPEQVRSAPPDVRRWLEQQIMESLGLRRPAPPMEAPRHLVGCDTEELRKVLALFQHSLPVVSVFFELARDPLMVSPQGLRVLRIDDIIRHCRLQAPAQVVACLEVINQAPQRGSGDAEAVMTVVDNNEHVLVPDVTARGIHAIWEEIVARRHAAAPAPGYAPGDAPGDMPRTMPEHVAERAPDAAPQPVASRPFQPYGITVQAPGGMPGGGLPR